MDRDRVVEFECNIDDMTAEELAYACEMFMNEGARDVQTMPVGMKKGRPGILLTVMCTDEEAEREKMLHLIFKYTTTIGIRELISERYILDRSVKTYETPYGPVRVKEVSGYGIRRRKIEYEDIARIAGERKISLSDAKELVKEFLKD